MYYIFNRILFASKLRQFYKAQMMGPQYTALAI